MNYSKMSFRRKQLGMNQSEVAKKAGISSGGYQKIEYGGNPTIKILEKISEILEVPMAYWWDDQLGMVNEPDVEYQRALIKENQKLKEQVERDQRVIDNLNVLIEKSEIKQKTKRAS